MGVRWPWMVGFCLLNFMVLGTKFKRVQTKAERKKCCIISTLNKAEVLFFLIAVKMLTFVDSRVTKINANMWTRSTCIFLFLLHLAPDTCYCHIDANKRQAFFFRLFITKRRIKHKIALFSLKVHIKSGHGTNLLSPFTSDDHRTLFFSLVFLLILAFIL